jgi:uncharacterized protein YndB with AHSA1/START domain
MEYGSIEREFQVEASPEVVFEVLSSPEHVREWWGAEAELEPTAGASGELAWGRGTPHAHIVPLTVVDADPPRTFSFRWAYSDGEVPSPTNSFLVRFELTPSGAGTVVRLTETGFRERGWEAAVLEAQYEEHRQGWDTHLGGLRRYLTRLVTSR